MERPATAGRAALTGVSFITTVFDKRPYLERVIAALAADTGPFEREFIFVDDGSSDGSAAMIADLTRDWREPVHILRQANAGAAAATNAGARRARLPWLRLVDGDDLIVRGATARLLEAAQATNMGFAYGELGRYRHDDPDPLAHAAPLPTFCVERDGLARFIRNCPCNSSTILVAAERYWAAGGCDVRMISPDQALFLRLFAKGGAGYVAAPVALAPNAAPRRLSEQTRRSRYDSVLALYYLVTETPGLEPRYQRLAYRRALSRARRFHRAHGGAVFSSHLVRDLTSHVFVPAAPGPAMYKALGAFTENGSSERPPAWMPGAVRPSSGAASELSTTDKA